MVVVGFDSRILLQQGAMWMQNASVSRFFCLRQPFAVRTRHAQLFFGNMHSLHQAKATKTVRFCA